MKKTFLTLIVFFVLLGVCSSVWAGGGRDQQNVPEWAGIYAGVIPAADCPGISVVAILNADKTYKFTYQYIDRDTELFTFTGIFQWDEKAKTITLDSRNLPSYYKVGKNSLIQLDLERNEIKGKLAGKYKLRKI